MHRRGYIITAQLQQGRRDIQEVGPLDESLEGTVQPGEDEGAMLSVVAVIGAGVIFPDMDGGIANTADRSPREPAEVDDEIGRHVANIVVDLLRLVDQRAECVAERIPGGLEPCLDLVAEPLVILSVDHASGLASRAR